MKSVTKKLFVLGGVFLMGMSLASCGVSQSAADKINKAAKEGNHYTYEKLIKSYGKPTIDATTDKSLLGSGKRNGLMVWVKGCKTLEIVEEKLDKGEQLSALTVTIIEDNATTAVWTDSYKSSSTK